MFFFFLSYKAYDISALKGTKTCFSSRYLGMVPYPQNLVLSLHIKCKQCGFGSTPVLLKGELLRGRKEAKKQKLKSLGQRDFHSTYLHHNKQSLHQFPHNFTVTCNSLQCYIVTDTLSQKRVWFNIPDKVLSVLDTS